MGNMDTILIVLLVAGLAAGAFLIGGGFLSNDTNNWKEPEDKKMNQSYNDGEKVKKLDSEEGKENEMEKEKATDIKKDTSLDSASVDSLDFMVDVTTDQGEVTTRYRVEDAGTEREKIRIDSEKEDGSRTVIILNESQRKGWVKDYSSEEWQSFSGLSFDYIWDNRSDQYLHYRVSSWKGMEGREFTVDENGNRARVYNIRVNNDIPNSVFEP